MQIYLKRDFFHLNYHLGQDFFYCCKASNFKVKNNEVCLFVHLFNSLTCYLCNYWYVSLCLYFFKVVCIYVAGLLVVVGGVVVQVMRQIDIGVKLYLLLHVAVAISN